MPSTRMKIFAAAASATFLTVQKPQEARAFDCRKGNEYYDTIQNTVICTEPYTKDPFCKICGYN